MANAGTSGEFDLIARYFAPLAGPEGLGLLDDAALIQPPAGMSLVFTKDVSVAGVHFPTNISADAIGWRALAVNLSDLAGKGAKPLGYLLGLGLTGRENDQWFHDFSGGLHKAQTFGRCQLYGGDTVRTGERLTISITAIGTVPEGGFVRRSGAKPGDSIYVSGTIGDAALGLDCSKGMLAHNDFLVRRLEYPEPRLALAGMLSKYARAGIDISDGLMADAGHIARTSDVELRIQADKIPLSDQGRAYVARNPDILLKMVTGGDDYEILACIKPGLGLEYQQAASRIGMKVTEIGEVGSGNSAVLLSRDHRPIEISVHGYQHF